MACPAEGASGPRPTDHYPWNEAECDRVPFSMRMEVGIGEDGLISFDPDPFWLHFQKALHKADPMRVRRCPHCGNFYFAVRSNTGACNEHLARVRMQRSRDPERRRQYEETRRINRLVHQEKMELKLARAKVQRRQRRRRI
jgi:hypothetical protein